MRADRYTLLLVEDDPADWMLFEAVLADQPKQVFDVTGVGTLAEALTLVESTAVDLVVVDLHLPDSDGWATFERVKPLCARLPVVLLSSLADEAFADRAVRAGAQNYLIKGEASGRLLVRLLLHAIERHRIQRLLAESEESFRWLVDGLADGLILLNEHGKAVLINRAARDMFPEGVDIASAAAPQRGWRRSPPTPRSSWMAPVVSMRKCGRIRCDGRASRCGRSRCATSLSVGGWRS